MSILINHPLGKFYCIKLDDNSEDMGLLRYERVVDICYRCGRIGHTSPVCDFPIALLDPEDIPYDKWILASTSSSGILANLSMDRHSILQLEPGESSMQREQPLEAYQMVAEEARLSLRSPHANRAELVVHPIQWHTEFAIFEFQGSRAQGNDVKPIFIWT